MLQNLGGGAKQFDGLDAARAHLIGFGIKKSQEMADQHARATGKVPAKIAEPCPPLNCEVGARPLTRGDSHVMLLSSGLLDLMTVASSAVLAHHFETREFQPLLDAAVIGTMERRLAAEGGNLAMAGR